MQKGKKEITLLIYVYNDEQTGIICLIIQLLEQMCCFLLFSSGLKFPRNGKNICKFFIFSADPHVSSSSTPVLFYNVSRI